MKYFGEFGGRQIFEGSKGSCQNVWNIPSQKCVLILWHNHTMVGGAKPFHMFVRGGANIFCMFEGGGGGVNIFNISTTPPCHNC